MARAWALLGGWVKGHTSLRGLPRGGHGHQAGLSPSSALGSVTREEGVGHHFLQNFFLNSGPGTIDRLLGDRARQREHPIFADTPCRARQFSDFHFPGSGEQHLPGRKAASSFSVDQALSWAPIGSTRWAEGAIPCLAGSPLVLGGLRGTWRALQTGWLWVWGGVGS